MDLRGGRRHGWSWFVLFLTLGHLALLTATKGVRPWHAMVDFGLLFLARVGPRGRHFTLMFIPFWLTAVLYDSLSLYLGLRGTIHVEDLHQAELHWFGVQMADGRHVLADYFLNHTWPVLDFVCGLAYIVYLFELILVFVYFCFRKSERFTTLAWGFLALNVLGIATYLIYPAAPPWYVQQYGLGAAQLEVPASSAGAAKFDEMTGISYFAHLYALSPNVFGAMPSLHAAYPVLVLCVLWGLGAAVIVPAAAFAVLVSFSAVYLRHHYVWDVLFGILSGVIAFGIGQAVQAFLARPVREVAQVPSP